MAFLTKELFRLLVLVGSPCPASYTLEFPGEVVCGERKTSDLLAFYMELIFKMWNQVCKHFEMLSKI